MNATPSDPLDRLYAAPLSDFVKERDRLAAELRKQGDKTGAAEVKALSKPSQAAWAVNQAARASPQGVKDLLETSDRMARLQLRAGADADSRQRFEAASAAHRRILAELVGRAENALKSSGHAATPVTLERVANNLRWGALDEDARLLLAQGRLLEDLAPQGFGAFAPSEPGDDGEATVDLGRSRPVILHAAPSPLSKKPAAKEEVTPGRKQAAPTRASPAKPAPRVEVGILRAHLREADKRVTQARRDLERRVEAARAADAALAELERRAQSAREAARVATEEQGTAEAALAEQEEAQRAASDALEQAALDGKRSR